jgi:OOP family OmpA-OmpF porin
VPNYLDKCPGTPAGVAVDKDGCPLDSDKDGVPDYLDKCPGTPAGVTVDKDGCPPPPAKVIDKMTLRVLFDSNKATLTETDVMELQKAVAFVKKYPGANIRIDGYTDSIGTDAYNLKLSERRATAVMDYLIKEAGVESSKITAIGHGEADPVADNKTEVGRAKNRRVEISILSE